MKKLTYLAPDFEKHNPLENVGSSYCYYSYYYGYYYCY
jgi:hypothetical protein